MTRRTQTERTASTRGALLDATIESLVIDGWAATTTRSVAQRAGVSQGAQQHHFPTKNDLVRAAITRLTEQLASSSTSGLDLGGTERERAESLLDQLWEIHNLPLNTAVYELINAARTDAEMVEDVVQVLDHAIALTQLAAQHLLPTIAAHPGFEEWLLLTEATMRGTTMVDLPGAEKTHLEWPALRRHLLLLLDTILEEQPRHS